MKFMCIYICICNLYIYMLADKGPLYIYIFMYILGKYIYIHILALLLVYDFSMTVGFMGCLYLDRVVAYFSVSFLQYTIDIGPYMVPF